MPLLFNFFSLKIQKPFFTDALLSLFYPRICAACSHSLFAHEKVICMHCERHLPKTGFNDWADNPMEKIFWGRIKIKRASALYFFGKGESVQTLMHQLKYKGRKDVGIWLGKQLGIALLKGKRFKEIDYIVPIPLHSKKQYQRGYNQSALIGRGIEASTGWAFSPLLIRTENTDSQTKKTKFERWENVSGKFMIKPGIDLKNQNILLIDDIITTGATLEATARVLIKAGAKSVSIATVAVA